MKRWSLLPKFLCVLVVLTLMTGVVIPQVEAVKRDSNGEGFVRISAGENHSLAIKSDGTLWGWGLNNYGQLGDGTNTNKNTPIQIGTEKKWVSVAVGGFHSLAIKSDGTL